MANTVGEKELKRDWPCVTGLDADSKHEGRQTNLKPEIATYVSKRQEVGMTHE